MKRLTCEMCGSTDLLKQDGVFVCQSCGCKYTVEEARKMMIEGTVDVTGSTVKVDNTDKLNKLLVLATRARKEDNTEDAKKYYEMAMIEDPTNWESSFYASYYRLLDSPIGQLPETLKNFNSRAISSLELIFSADFQGNVFDTVNDFLASTAKLYILVTTHEITRREAKKKEFMDVSMGYAFNKVSQSMLESTREDYTKNIKRSFELLSAIRAAIFKLCALAEPRKAGIDVANLTAMYDLCDTIYKLDAQSVVEMDDYLGFTNSALSYEQMRKDENPDYVSQGVEMLMEKGKLIYKDGKGNPKGKEITDLIEKRRKEYQQARAKRYWAAHLEEYNALVNEGRQLSSQIRDLKNAYDLEGKKNQLKGLSDSIEKMTAERDSLGIFKGKEKKALQEKIDAAQAQSTALQKKLAAATADLEKKLAPLNNRLAQISARLNQAG